MLRKDIGMGLVGPVRGISVMVGGDDMAESKLHTRRLTQWKIGILVSGGKDIAQEAHDHALKIIVDWVRSRLAEESADRDRAWES
jgi:hypothetical protein